MSDIRSLVSDRRVSKNNYSRADSVNKLQSKNDHYQQYDDSMEFGLPSLNNINISYSSAIRDNSRGNSLIDER